MRLKYHYVVGALDQATASRLVDFLSHLPSTNQYDALKTRLLTTFGLSCRERAARLLRLRGLGDRKPSDLMDEMLALADGHSSCFLFEQIFLEQLPEDVHLQLTSADFSDPRRVALLADSIWLAQDQGSAAASMCSVASASHGVSSKPCGEWRPTQHEDGDVICFYHARFGKRANKCRPPCKHSGNALTGPSVSRLFCLRDGPSDLEFLIDTGAEVSVFPATSMDLRSARHDCTRQTVPSSALLAHALCHFTSTLGGTRGILSSLMSADPCSAPISFATTGSSWT